MKTKTPDAVRLSRKKYTFQLPLALAAGFEALCDLHADTRRAQVLADVLALGLAQVARARADHEGAAGPTVDMTAPDPTPAVYLLHGPFAEFHKLVRMHHLALEHALSGDEPMVPAVHNYRLVDLE